MQYTCAIFMLLAYSIPGVQKANSRKDQAVLHYSFCLHLLLGRCLSKGPSSLPYDQPGLGKERRNGLKHVMLRQILLTITTLCRTVTSSHRHFRAKHLMRRSTTSVCPRSALNKRTVRVVTTKQSSNYTTVKKIVRVLRWEPR